MFKKYKKELLLITFGIIIYVLLINFNATLTFLGAIVNIFSPVIVGFIIAFILNVPMTGVEKLTVRITRGKITNIKPGLRRFINLIITLVLVAAVVSVVFVLLIPDLFASAISLYYSIIDRLPEIMAYMNEYNINASKIATLIHEIEVEELLGSTVSVATTAVSTIVQFLIALIIGLYALMSKEELRYQTNRLLDAFFKDVFAAKVRNIANLTNHTFSKFLSGQCLEACILGCLLFICLSVAGIPYADIIGALTIICAFVPYVGAIMSFTVGVILVVIVAPQKVILYAVIVLVVQFIESHFIYPHVVGNSVGMKPLWTLIAVIVGGKLMGLFGMIFFIPLMAVIVTLFKDYTDRMLTRKEHFHEYEVVKGFKHDSDNMSGEE